MQDDQGATRGVVIKFIKVHVKEVMASEDWKANAKDHPRLIEEILPAVAEHMEEHSE